MDEGQREVEVEVGIRNAEVGASGESAAKAKAAEKKPPCPFDPACAGPASQVMATCRPGETDVSIVCAACGRSKHAVLDAAGRPLDDAALQKLRGGGS